MSLDDHETVRRFFAELLEDSGALERLAHEEVVYIEDPKWPGAGTYEGRRAVAECWAKYDELLGSDVSVDLLDVRNVGEAVLATVRVSGRARNSGVPYDHTWGYVCRTRDAKVAYFRAYFDPSEAQEQAAKAP